MGQIATTRAEVGSDRSPLPDPALVRFNEAVSAAASGSMPSTASSQVQGADDDETRRHGPDGLGLDEASRDASRPPRSRRDEFSEHDAVRYVCAYAERVLGVKEIRDRQNDRCGWDLEFIYPDDRVERVEVKGSTGLGPFEITRNELDRAREHHEHYVVYYLANQATARPLLLRFDDFGLKVTDEHLRAASWAVVGWRALDPAVVEIELPDGWTA